MSEDGEKVRRIGIFEFSSKVTLADLVGIVMAGVALVYAFAKLDGTDQRHNDRIKALEDRQAVIERTQADDRRMVLDELKQIRSSVDQLLGRETARAERGR